MIQEIQVIPFLKISIKNNNFTQKCKIKTESDREVFLHNLMKNIYKLYLVVKIRLKK